ncbi:hypothetical protein WMY93_028667 [Mugilogobius chulae]|uniref:Uncharacterized protein n=1 Tax=Mugilogobius chulae TaxID=88201 RepID=A0AAW0MVP4_9GOBI
MMGNCTSGKKKKSKTEHSDDEDAQPPEDVTYASIDHSNSKATTAIRATAEPECDYATVNVPRALLQETDCDYATVNMPKVTLQETDCDYATVNMPTRR